MLTHDAYSLSLDGGRRQWTLLRAPKMAWGGGRPAVYAGRDVHTDQGVHRAKLDVPAGGGLEPGAPHRAARRLVQPPVVVERSEAMERPPWGAVAPPALWTGAEQRARRDGRGPAGAERRLAGDALFAPIRRTEA